MRDFLNNIIIARINCRLKPILRGELFEDPLDNLLKENDYGTVTGGGTQLTSGYEIAYCELEIQLKEMSTPIYDFIKQQLEILGAPKGSHLEVPDGELPFGINEGLAIYLNGVDLASEVYANNDVNEVCDEIDHLIEGSGAILGHWNGPETTALYLYGPSEAVMKEKIAAYLGSHPLCQKARLERIAG